jgi:hypothetical protein
VIGPDLLKELLQLLDPDGDGLGRVGYLRKTSGQAPVAPGGEYNPNDPRFSEGRNYKDYKVHYYRATTVSDQDKGPIGRVDLQQEVVYLAASATMPKPSRNDKIIELEFDESTGLPLVPHRPSKSYISIDSLIEYWGDDHGRMVLYVLKPSKP